MFNRLILLTLVEFLFHFVDHCWFAGEHFQIGTGSVLKFIVSWVLSSENCHCNCSSMKCTRSTFQTQYMVQHISENCGLIALNRNSDAKHGLKRMICICIMHSPTMASLLKINYTILLLLSISFFLLLSISDLKCYCDVNILIHWPDFVFVCRCNSKLNQIFRHLGSPCFAVDYSQYENALYNA